jgi:isochorismate synthase
MLKETAQKTIEKQIYLENSWVLANQYGYALVAWRMPMAECTFVLVNFDGATTPYEIDFEDTVSGFCIAEYHAEKGANCQLIEADLILKITESTFEIVEDKDPEKSFNFINDLQATPSPKTPLKYTIAGLTHEQNHYETIVNKAIETIESGSMQKVVLSRTKDIHLSEQINPIDIFEKLCKKYLSAFNSLVYLPQTKETWLGASPETLVSYNNNGMFKTMALAGTQHGFDSYGHEISPSQAKWSQKEIEEQAMVSRYIINCLKKVRVREYLELGPKTIKAGHLLHLRTDFIVDTHAIHYLNFASDMLTLLNPTSAVCGMPKASAMRFIAANENYERSYYSGFLGPKNIENHSELFVNLRCTRIKDQCMTFFAGAGITEDSVPQREWAETELKIDTLLRILHE